VNEEEPKIRIYVNSNSHMSRGKYAAAAVHAALTAAGAHPGLPVVVLGAQRDHVVKHETVIYDAGRTEVEPGTPTAGTDWTPASTREAAYESVRAAGWLTDDPFVNARIWRSVEAALDTRGCGPTDSEPTS
jgi:PTH2 family peptidyl-tRNA hydrolase